MSPYFCGVHWRAGQRLFTDEEAHFKVWFPKFHGGAERHDTDSLWVPSSFFSVGLSLREQAVPVPLQKAVGRRGPARMLQGVRRERLLSGVGFIQVWVVFRVFRPFEGEWFGLLTYLIEKYLPTTQHLFLLIRSPGVEASSEQRHARKPEPPAAYEHLQAHHARGSHQAQLPGDHVPPV